MRMQQTTHTKADRGEYCEKEPAMAKWRSNGPIDQQIERAKHKGGQLDKGS